MPVNNPPRAVDYDNAAEDLQSIEDVVNGPISETVTTRLGQEVKTLAGAISEIENGTAFISKENGVQVYDNYAELTALPSSSRFDGMIVYVRSRSTIGDGGEGIFRFSSGDQSALVTADPEGGIYVAPDDASTGASGVWVRDTFRGWVNPQWFGAIAGTSEANGPANYTAFQAAIDFIGYIGAGFVEIPSATFVIDGTLEVDFEGCFILGKGTLNKWLPSSWQNKGSQLIGMHTNGDVLRAMASSFTARNFRINSTSTRAGASAGSNYGLRIEAADENNAALRVNYCIVDNVFVIQQPNHGICVIGESVGCVVQDSTVKNCGGHGIVVDRGDATGRTNVTQGGVNIRPGIVTFLRNNTSDNVGHGLCVGHPSNGAFTPYRVDIRNHESFRNAQTSGVRHVATCDYMRGENITYAMGASGGLDLSSTPVVSCLYIHGRNNKLDNFRMIGPTTPAIIVGQGGVNTDGLEITQPFLFSSSPIANLIEFPAGVVDVRMWIPYSDGFTNVSSTLSNVTRYLLDVNGVVTDTRNLASEWRVLERSAVAVPLTGTTSETELADFTIPAGGMGPNGAIRVTCLWSFTNNANTKTLRVKYGSVGGGTSFMNRTVTTNGYVKTEVMIYNRNDQASQLGGPIIGSDDTTTSANATATFDTAANPSEVRILAQLANSADTVTLEAYTIELAYGA